MSTNNLTVVYMVAGMSSRFGGKIKQFAKVGPSGETLIEYSIAQALKAGAEKIVFIVGEKTTKPFREMFGDSYKGVPVKYAVQSYNQAERDKPWGTVDALCSAEEVLDGPFIVCNGDDIYGENAFKQLAEHIKSGGSAATVGYPLLQVLPDQGNVNRGIFKTNGDKVIHITETFNLSKENYLEKGLSEKTLCSMNMFALPARIVTVLSGMLISFKLAHPLDRKSECLLPTEVNHLIDAGKLDMKIFAATQPWFGVTNPEDEEIVKSQLASLR